MPRGAMVDAAVSKTVCCEFKSRRGNRDVTQWVEVVGLKPTGCGFKSRHPYAQVAEWRRRWAVDPHCKRHRRFESCPVHE